MMEEDVKNIKGCAKMINTLCINFLGGKMSPEVFVIDMNTMNNVLRETLNKKEK